MKNLREVEDMDFANTTISLNKTCRMGFNQALQVIERGGGKVEGEQATIACQLPKPVRYEKAFEGHFPVKKINLHKILNQSPELSFEGIGFVVKGGVQCEDRSFVALVEVYLNEQLMETAQLSAAYRTRRNDLTWKYQLPKGKYKVSFKWLNPRSDANVTATEALIYSDAPAVPKHKSISKKRQ
jgi:hypothetical protein